MKIVSSLAVLTLLSAFSLPPAGAEDVFDARPDRVVVVKPKPSTTPSKPSPAAKPAASAAASAAKGDSVRLRRGEIREIFRSSRSANPEMAFYLPPEGVGIVQVVIESKGGQVSYYLKGLKPGRTVGGAVERGWLDREGFSARNPADEARIQIAIKRKPLHIAVE